jgi:hypothetical protein
VETKGKQHILGVQVFFNDLDPKAVWVELYTDGVNSGAPVRQEMKRDRKLGGDSWGCHCSTAMSTARAKLASLGLQPYEIVIHETR